jgi:hypothetical protein
MSVNGANSFGFGFGGTSSTSNQFTTATGVAGGGVVDARTPAQVYAGIPGLNQSMGILTSAGMPGLPTTSAGWQAYGGQVTSWASGQVHSAQSETDKYLNEMQAAKTKEAVLEKSHKVKKKSGFLRGLGKVTGAVGKVLANPVVASVISGGLALVGVPVPPNVIMAAGGAMTVAGAGMVTAANKIDERNVAKLQEKGINPAEVYTPEDKSRANNNTADLIANTAVQATNAGMGVHNAVEANRKAKGAG